MANQVHVACQVLCERAGGREIFIVIKTGFPNFDFRTDAHLVAVQIFMSSHLNTSSTYF